MAVMGRPKGATGRGAEDARDFVCKLERRLKAKGIKYGLASIAERLLDSDDPKVVAMVWAKLTEYRYGKPTEHMSHSGELSLVIDMPGPERERT